MELLDDARRNAADGAVEDYDFGDFTVEGMNGWERISPGREWTKTIFVREEGDIDSTAVSFVVRFAADASAEIETAGVSGWKTRKPRKRKKPAPPNFSEMAWDYDLIEAALGDAPNVECLEDLRCPNPLCLHSASLNIDNLGVIDDERPALWKKRSLCVCPVCAHRGTIRDFEVPAEQEVIYHMQVAYRVVFGSRKLDTPEVVALYRTGYLMALARRFGTRSKKHQTPVLQYPLVGAKAHGR